MSAKANKQSIARRRAGRRLMEVIKLYELDLKMIAKETKVDLVTLENLDRFTPHLNTIERVSIYLEMIARKLNRKKKAVNVRPSTLARAQLQQKILIENIQGKGIKKESTTN